MVGDIGMTRETLETLIGRMFDAETRDTPPPTGEEEDWLYGSAGSPHPISMGGWRRCRPRVSGCRERWCSGAWRCGLVHSFPGSSGAIRVIRWRAGPRSRQRYVSCTPQRRPEDTGTSDR